MSQSAIPVPLAIEPSGQWIGIDGNWSSFALMVGTPGQSFLTLPATGTNVIWVPVPEGCSGLEEILPDCGASRGVLTTSGPESNGFNTNASATWNQTGLYGLPVEQSLFDQAQNGLYGLETVVFGQPQTAALENQVVAGISSADLWVGAVGLGAPPAQFTERGESVPSLLSATKNASLAPSVSFGYTAGASYRNSPGSLIIGGFDESAFEKNDVSFLTDADALLRANVRSLVVANSLIGTVAPPLGETGISVIVDSTYPDLWLPGDVCDFLADALNLTLDATNGRYLIDSQTHSALVAAAPEFTFTLAANESSAPTMQIVLPYSAVDLRLLPPIYASTVPYFPMRQAPEGSNLILGRAFLQEAYIAVDWERGNFSLGQAVTEASTPNIVSILSPVESSSGPRPLGAGPLAGIVIGSVVAVAIVALGLWWWRRSVLRKKQVIDQQKSADSKTEVSQPADIDLKTETWAQEKGEATELHAQDFGAHEVQSTELRELHGEDIKHQLMSTPVYELDADFRPNELESPRV